MARMMREKLLYEVRPTHIHHYYHPLPFGSGGGNMYHRKCCFICSIALLPILFVLYGHVYHEAQNSENETHTVAISGWSYNTSRDLRRYVLPDNVTAIIPQLDLCSSPDLFLLVVVCSAVANFKARAAIRETWASAPSITNSSSSFKVAFLLGDPENSTLQELVDDENLHYSDIIQEGFVDSYNNLTLKSVMMLKWVSTNCRSVQYIMKTDDDMFVNINNLVRLLKVRILGNLLVGALICGARPIADSQNKWYAPHYMYQGTVYPNYLSGTGYVMSRDVVLRLYQAALKTPLFHLEDVYLTGLCAHAARIRPRHHPSFTYSKRKLDPCLYKDKTVVTSHRVNGSEMRKVWSLMNNPQLDCTGFTITSAAAQKSGAKNGKQHFINLKRSSKCF
ncbi:beta-1,3-galactosyltransferase 1-like isoform X2 [Zootermopsis nevadensis]|uniref:beta-1,3-galactosyltransferase 1-like isoform X2 n=1 Tax=Zootermopsis nevadensis TaxID=136037 RepID=UPI000B8EC75F|nr:beta-1,3-galactosyltransferase 1-like isoform X2 [Zootermopsis nevadensis]